MNYFIQVFVMHLIKVLCFGFVAYLGCYLGYRANHGFEIYFKKQKKLIKKRGNLIAYMNRHYKVYNKRNSPKNREWLYIKCKKYAEKINRDEFEYAKIYLKSDIKLFEILSLIITVCVSMSTPLIDAYAEILAMWHMGVKSVRFLSEPEMLYYEEICGELKILVGLIYMMLIVIYIYKITKIVKKQQTLLSILESMYK